MIDIEGIVATCVIGLIGTMVFGTIATLIFLLFKYPPIFLAIIGVIIALYMIGWCIVKWEEFYTFMTFKSSYKVPPPPIPLYGIPVLDGLQRLERKYNISTTQFMSFVYHKVIPVGMDNLDYLEWVSLVNELSFVEEE